MGIAIVIEQREMERIKRMNHEFGFAVVAVHNILFFAKAVHDDVATTDRTFFDLDIFFIIFSINNHGLSLQNGVCPSGFWFVGAMIDSLDLLKTGMPHCSLMEIHRICSVNKKLVICNNTYKVGSSFQPRTIRIERMPRFAIPDARKRQ